MKSFSARELTCTAIGVALIVICSWVSVPTAIPFTLQTFAVCLVTALLGLKMSLWAVLCYIALALVGVPVLSGFRGGPGALLGVTGGYVVGFLFTALTVGFAVKKRGRSLPVLVFSMAAGILLCYAFGTAWFMIAMDIKEKTYTIAAALSACVIPFIIPDLVKLAAAMTISKQIKRIGITRRR